MFPTTGAKIRPAIITDHALITASISCRYCEIEAETYSASSAAIIGGIDEVFRAAPCREL